MIPVLVSVRPGRPDGGRLERIMTQPDKPPPGVVKIIGKLYRSTQEAVLVMTEPNPSPESSTPPLERLPLAELYPACFDWKKPRPLKLGIHRDLIAAGYEPKRVRRALGAYCSRPSYQKAMRPGATRLDLSGQPAGVVTETEIELARASHAQRRLATDESLPNDIPLPQENLMAGRLELTVKFSALPKPLAVRDGMKVGFQTEGAVVVAVLSPKVWRKLEQAARNWPSWQGILTGQLDRQEDGALVLKQPVLQVFEKKPKPAAE